MPHSTSSSQLFIPIFFWAALLLFVVHAWTLFPTPSQQCPPPQIFRSIPPPHQPFRSVYTLLPTTSSFLPFQRKQVWSHCYTEERKGRRYRLRYRTGNTSQLKISLTFLQRKIFLLFQLLHTGGHNYIRMDGTFSWSHLHKFVQIWMHICSIETVSNHAMVYLTHFRVISYYLNRCLIQFCLRETNGYLPMVKLIKTGYVSHHLSGLKQGYSVKFTRHICLQFILTNVQWVLSV